MHRGYIKLWRCIEDDELWRKKKFTKFEAWIDLLLQTQHSDEPQNVVIGNTVFVCNKGESLKSLETWSKRWRWSKTSTQRYFILLQNLSKICYKNETKTVRISICNWDRYQDTRNDNGTQVKRKRNANGTILESDNNVKNDKNDKNVKNTTCRKLKFDDGDSALTEILVGLMAGNNPEMKPITEEQKNKWSNVFRMMREIDNRTHERIEEVLRWSQQDSFWKGNILSADKLRKQFDTLVLRMKGDSNGTKRNGYSDGETFKVDVE